jgi:hypothetical protein
VREIVRAHSVTNRGLPPVRSTRAGIVAAEGDRDQQVERADLSGQEGEQIDGLQVGDVNVLDDPQRGPGHRERGQHALPQLDRRPPAIFDPERAQARPDRKVGRRLGQLPGPPDHHLDSPPRRFARQGLDQRRLADAGFSRDRRQTAASRQVRVAPDQRGPV